MAVPSPPRPSTSTSTVSFFLRVGRHTLLAFGALIILLQCISVHYQHLKIHSNWKSETESEQVARRRGLSSCPLSSPKSSPPFSFDWNVKPLLSQKEPRTWEIPSFQAKQPLNFVHVPKTGGSSVVQAAIDAGLNWGDCLFQQHWPGRSCPKPPPSSSSQNNWTLVGDKVWWHMPIPQLPDKHPYEGFDLFAITRNPYDRAVSEFYYHCDSFPNLCKGLDGRRAARVLNRNIQKACKTLLMAPHKSDDYLFHMGHWIPQSDFFYNRKGHRLIEHLLHTEYMDEEFKSLVKAYGYTNLTLPHQAIKKRNDQRMTVQNLTLATVKLIEVVYEQDFEVGGYEIWSPKLSFWLEEQQPQEEMKQESE